METLWRHWNVCCLTFIYKDSQCVTDEQTYEAQFYIYCEILKLFFLHDTLCNTLDNICPYVALFYWKMLKVRENTRTCDGLINCSLCVNKKVKVLNCIILWKTLSVPYQSKCIATVRWKHPTLVHCILLLEQLVKKKRSIIVPWSLFCSRCIF